MSLAAFIASLAFLFVLGILTGLAIAFFIASLLAKKHPDAATFKEVIAGSILVTGSRRGSIHMPTPDVEEAREAIIRENAAQGKDTPIEQLRDHD